MLEAGHPGNQGWVGTTYSFPVPWGALTVIGVLCVPPEVGVLPQGKCEAQWKYGGVE